VVSARGGLNNYVWPQIEGLWSFKGKVVHSAAWDESCVNNLWSVHLGTTNSDLSDTTIPTRKLVSLALEAVPSRLCPSYRNSQEPS
jgi:hypothetical protein